MANEVEPSLSVALVILGTATEGGHLYSDGDTFEITGGDLFEDDEEDEDDLPF